MYQLRPFQQPITPTSDQYLISVLNKYVVDFSKVSPQINALVPVFQRWGNKYLLESIYSGSIAKGTCISLCADADIFLSLSSTTQETLGQIYETLHNAVVSAGFQARKQNVSIGVFTGGVKIDLVPGKRQGEQGYDHSLFKNKGGTWTKTNVKKHVSLVSTSNRQNEIRLAKIWREHNGLDFPSFYLELAMIDFLKGSKEASLANRFWAFLGFLSGSFMLKKYLDPANSNNVISDDLSLSDRLKIKQAADIARKKKTWREIVW
jgi:hypothetical protein